MLYLKVDANQNVIAANNQFPEECNQPGAWARDIYGNLGHGWLNRTDITSLEQAQALADSASGTIGYPFLAVDRGTHVSPRYDVIEAPMVGDEVSMAFNGDYYPVGKITRIGAGYKQIKVVGPDGDKVFRRRGGENGPGWLYQRTWRLVDGKHSRLNQEF